MLSPGVGVVGGRLAVLCCYVKLFCSALKCHLQAELNLSISVLPHGPRRVWRSIYGQILCRVVRAEGIAIDEIEVRMVKRVEELSVDVPMLLMIDMSASNSLGPRRKIELPSTPGVDSGWIAPPVPNRFCGRITVGTVGTGIVTTLVGLLESTEVGPA
jgi:hypothetical protein